MNKIVCAGVGIMILQDKLVLLGKRNPNKEKASSELEGAGTWTMPGGKIDFGETYIAAAIRETKEETGIKLEEESIELLCINNDITETAHFVTIGFIYESSDSFEPQIMEPDTIIEWKWFSLDALPEKIYGPSEKLISHYLKTQND